MWLGDSMIAISFDNLLFFLLIAVAALFQLLSTAISKARKRDSNQTSTAPTPPPRRPTPQTPHQSDADRIRKFLEALGQPPTSTPPPPVVPRTDIAPRPLSPVQPPVIMPAGFRLPQERRQKREVSKEQRHPSEHRTDLQRAVPASASTPPSALFEVHKWSPVEVQQAPVIKPIVEPEAAASQPFAERGDFKTNVAALLASTSKLREAVLLCEILGTPRGLQSLDGTR